MNSAFITALKGEILLRERDKCSAFQISFFCLCDSVLKARNLSGLEKKIYERIVCVSEDVWFLAAGPFISVQPLDLWEASACESVLQVSISLNKVELSVGESKFFTCTVIGEPVSINWFSPQGERIISNQRVIVHTEGVRSRLTIYNAIIEDAGIYRCQAVDAKGQSQEATVVLEIYQKLTFLEVKTPQEFRQSEDAEVVCDVISSPVPAVSWFYKNREITSEPN
ncbi:hypothetical protein cypCar_00033422, partial [Cyprinus carpio]